MHRRCQRRLGAGATDTCAHRFVRLSGGGRGLNSCPSQTPSQHIRLRYRRPRSLGRGGWALQSFVQPCLVSYCRSPDVEARRVSCHKKKEPGTWIPGSSRSHPEAHGYYRLFSLKLCMGLLRFASSSFLSPASTSGFFCPHYYYTLLKAYLIPIWGLDSTDDLKFRSADKERPRNEPP